MCKYAFKFLGSADSICLIKLLFDLGELEEWLVAKSSSPSSPTRLGLVPDCHKEGTKPQATQIPKESTYKLMIHLRTFSLR